MASWINSWNQNQTGNTSNITENWGAVPPTAIQPPTAVLNPTQYTAEQWLALQQQNWQQWMQWQQQYQQWQQQYGEQYAKAMQSSVMDPTGHLANLTMPTFNTTVPSVQPPLPPENKPPPPPADTSWKPPLPKPTAETSSINQQNYDQNNKRKFNEDKTAGKQNKKNTIGLEQSEKQDKSILEMSEAERKFDEQFKEWEEQFNKWKEQNVNHPDKQQYREYEAKWEQWRCTLLERREQMRKKRLAAQNKQSIESTSPKQMIDQISKNNETNFSSVINDQSTSVSDKFVAVNPISDTGLQNNDQFGYNEKLTANNNDQFGSKNRFGQNNDRFGQNNDRFGQNNDRFGQNINRFGQNNNKFGQTNDKFGENNDKFEQNNDKFGQNNDRFGQNNDKFGQNNDKFRQNNDRFGQNNDRFGQIGQNNDKFRQNNDRFGQNNDRFGQNNDKFGQNIDKFGHNIDNFGQTNDKFGQNDGKFGQNNDKFGQNDGKFGQKNDRFRQNDDRYGQNNERFRQNDNRFGQNNERFGQNNDRFGENNKFGQNNRFNGSFGSNDNDDDRFRHTYDKYDDGDNRYDRFGRNNDRFGQNNDRFGQMDNTNDNYGKHYNNEQKQNIDICQTTKRAATAGFLNSKEELTSFNLFESKGSTTKSNLNPEILNVEVLPNKSSQNKDDDDENKERRFLTNDDGFLNQTNNSNGGGIPGLDLADEPEKEKPTGPDFDAITRGINTILEDKNLLTMISMVTNKTDTNKTSPPSPPPPPVLVDNKPHLDKSDYFSGGVLNRSFQSTFSGPLQFNSGPNQSSLSGLGQSNFIGSTTAHESQPVYKSPSLFAPPNSNFVSNQAIPSLLTMPPISQPGKLPSLLDMPIIKPPNLLTDNQFNNDNSQDDANDDKDDYPEDVPERFKYLQDDYLQNEQNSNNSQFLSNNQQLMKNDQHDFNQFENHDQSPADKITDHVQFSQRHSRTILEQTNETEKVDGRRTEGSRDEETMDILKNMVTIDHEHAPTMFTPVKVFDYEHKSTNQIYEDCLFIRPSLVIEYDHKPKHLDKEVHENYSRRSDWRRSDESLPHRYHHHHHRGTVKFNDRDSAQEDIRRENIRQGGGGVNNDRKHLNKYLNDDDQYYNDDKHNKYYDGDDDDRAHIGDEYNKYNKHNQDKYKHNDKKRENNMINEKERDRLFPSFGNDDNDDCSLTKNDTKTLNLQSRKLMTQITLIDDLLSMPGRINRPHRIVIILRGPPGSGKSYLAKLIKDKEAMEGGTDTRILSLDDYFMVEVEKEIIDRETGRRVKQKEMQYEFEKEMETVYTQSLVKSFKKTITDGYFSFIIVDCVNCLVQDYQDMWSFAKQNGFQVYICQLELDTQLCIKRNTHNRSEDEIIEIINNWESTPVHHIVLDATSLLQDAAIADVEMEEISDTEDIVDTDKIVDDDNNDHDNSEIVNDDSNEEFEIGKSKWDMIEPTIDKLARLDGINKPMKHSSMKEYLTLEDDEWIEPEVQPGKKRVRWADLVEKREQDKMRAIGFVVGQTDWNRMLDPSQGSSALTQTKYIESRQMPKGGWWNNIRRK